jgi:hypothetical protein
MFGRYDGGRAIIYTAAGSERQEITLRARVTEKKNSGDLLLERVISHVTHGWVPRILDRVEFKRDGRLDAMVAL